MKKLMLIIALFAFTTLPALANLKPEPEPVGGSGGTIPTVAPIVTVAPVTKEYRLWLPVIMR